MSNLWKSSMSWNRQSLKEWSSQMTKRVSKQSLHWNNCCRITTLQTFPKNAIRIWTSGIKSWRKETNRLTCKERSITCFTRKDRRTRSLISSTIYNNSTIVSSPTSMASPSSTSYSPTLSRIRNSTSLYYTVCLNGSVSLKMQSWTRTKC